MTDAAPVSAYRLFEVEVRRTARLSPSFTRFTFTGDDLDRFADNGYDQRIKFVLPLPGVALSTLPRGDGWFARWRALPDERRNPIRTYTVRAVRRHAREVDVDLVLHGEAGPATRWATHAVPGDAVALLGPDTGFLGDNGGAEFRPPAGTSALLLAGDETAVPAVASILERLPAGAWGDVLLEVPGADDRLPLVAPPGVRITWLPRGDGAHGRLLEPLVQKAAARLVGRRHASVDEPAPPDDGTDLIWDVPQPGAAATSEDCGPGVYAWLAGEAGVITSLRRQLVRDLGVDRRRVAFMGYWRQGRAES